MTHTTTRVEAVRRISGSARLAEMVGLSRLPAAGDVIGYGPAGDDALGRQHRVTEVGGHPVRARLTWADAEPAGPDLNLLHARLEQLADPHPGAFAAVPAWHGVVRDATGRERVAFLGGDPCVDQPSSLRQLLTVEPSGFLARPLWERLRLATAVAEAVAALGEVPLVHGGISTATVLADADRSTAVLTGVAGGAVGRSGAHRVPAFDGHLAPELYDGWGVHPEVADASTDHWSLAVVIHHVLFGTHPYCHLPDLAPTTLRSAMSGAAAFPPADPAYRAYRNWWRAEFAALPTRVADLFRQVLSHGWADRRARPSAADWATELGRWGGPPRVDQLEIDSGYVLAGQPVTVSWRTRYADTVLLAVPGHDVLTDDASGSLRLTPTVTGPVRLRAVGPFGSVETQSAPVAVLAVPPWLAAAPMPPAPSAVGPAVATPVPDLHLAPFRSRPAPLPVAPRNPVATGPERNGPPPFVTLLVSDPGEEL
ncbi:hypothetical protein [Micromonospora sp. NBC_01638]|uniref:hypothetical protein n=1 Tax=Micromonospora sp. NBC_01638 TaxID=2975982 RepID=UPI00386B56E3|nr:hypothetical protein OG811_13915 [Micromonospora sp. NBC_01638]